MMRLTVLAVLLALVASASATSTWADIQKVVAAGATGEFSHGPELIYGGEEWNGDKTVLRSTNSYAAKSVITGKDSYYPQGLPQTLKTPYLVPDSTHPKLAFWYAPAPSPEQGSTCQVAARFETKCAKHANLRPLHLPGTHRTSLSRTARQMATGSESGRTWPTSATRWRCH
jgi:hypothetical protein